MYGKSIFVMIIGWADRSSAFSSPCVWTWNGRWCRLDYQSLYSRRLGRCTIGHLNSFLGAKLDIYTIRTLNSITLWQLTIWNGGKLDSCRAANKLVIDNFLARTGLDIFMGWSVQDSVVFCGFCKKGKWRGDNNDEPSCTRVTPLVWTWDMGKKTVSVLANLGYILSWGTLEVSSEMKPKWVC